MNQVALILLSIAASWMIAAPAIAADDKDNRFVPGKAASHPGHQTSEKITIAAIPYITEAQAKSAFGKVNPYKEGVLPILLVIDNNTGRALRVADLVVKFVDASGRNVEPTPAKDVPYLEGAERPRMPGTTPRPIPNPLPRKPKKKALDTWEIDGRAFSHKMVPPGDTVHGFFYFQARYGEGSTLFVNGIRDAGSGKEFFYFEIPLIAKP